MKTKKERHEWKVQINKLETIFSEGSLTDQLNAVEASLLKGGAVEQQAGCANGGRCGNGSGCEKGGPQSTPVGGPCG